MTRWVMSALFALSLALATSCGGGDASSSSEEGGAATASGGGEAGEDATDGGRRRAIEGGACDFGGAAERTCLRGLYCCYGPPDDPGEQGACMPECPEY
jgi:hypothetical protein